MTPLTQGKAVGVEEGSAERTRGSEYVVVIVERMAQQGMVLKPWASVIVD